MRTILVLCSALLAGCVVHAEPAPPPPPGPSYLYVYAHGCWADDAWYEPCPWYAGPHIGYYYRYGGHYYWQPRYVWDVRVRRPPPRAWRDHRPSPGARVPPPRVRDHRRPPPHPRVRDHR